MRIYTTGREFFAVIAATIDCRIGARENVRYVMAAATTEEAATSLNPTSQLMVLQPMQLPGRICLPKATAIIDI